MAELNEKALEEVTAGAEDHNVMLTGSSTDEHYIDVEPKGWGDYEKVWG